MFFGNNYFNVQYVTIMNKYNGNINIIWVIGFVIRQVATNPFNRVSLITIIIYVPLSVDCLPVDICFLGCLVLL